MSGAFLLSAGVIRLGLLNTALPNAFRVTTGDATIELDNDGTYVISQGPQTGNWVEIPSTALAAFFEVKVTVTGGALTSGTVGSWLALTSNRSWAALSATVTIQFREAVSQVVRSTQTGITMTGIA